MRCDRAYHNDPRGTEPALASIGNSKSLLGSVWLLHISDSLNSDDMLAVDTCDRCNAGIHRRVVELLGRGVHLRDNLVRVRDLTVPKDMEVG